MKRLAFGVCLGLGALFMSACDSTNGSLVEFSEEDEKPVTLSSSSESSAGGKSSGKVQSSSSVKQSSSSIKYKEEADSSVVQDLLDDPVNDETNVKVYEDPFSQDDFKIAKYMVFFATMNPSSVKGEEITFYFDGLPKNDNKYIQLYYLPDDFDYNSAAVSGGEAVLVYKGLIRDHLARDLYPEDVYPEDTATGLTHCQFTSAIDDVIHTSHKWDGKHRQVMVLMPNSKGTSTVLLSETSERSLLFGSAPSWAADAYNMEVGDVFDIPASTIDSSSMVYFRADQGILVTTRSGEVPEEEIENVLGGRGELIDGGVDIDIK